MELVVRPGRTWLKHGLDRVTAIAVLPIVLPIIGALALAIKLEDLVRGDGSAPVFYREQRYSANRLFDLLKFRVLTAPAYNRLIESGLTEIKKHEHDPRAVSKVGSVLVSFYLDELPQLLHVVSGVMSLVGPRPVLPRDRRRQDCFEPYRIKSGLAGTFQLGKNTGDILDLDKQYLARYATLGPLELVLYDCRIIVLTIRKMLLGEGF